ncbi:MAG: penicillin-binding transpeptidase domain-containing protein [Lachnospiraceae bacterium]
MFDIIKDYVAGFFKSRLIVLMVIMILIYAILIQRVFTLQIIHGEEYATNHTLRIEKERVLKSTRGNIYDRNGKLLAYNELAYSVTIEDNGSYGNLSEKNLAINTDLTAIIDILNQNGDAVDNDFYIDLNEDGSYSYNATGTTRQRFLADVYGVSKIDDLSFNDKLGYDESEATAEQVMAYLMGSTKFGVDAEYSPDIAYQITVIRFAISQNSYQKYISTTIASDVSDETVAYINENAYDLQGVEIADDTIRKYVDSKYFAHIIGYTGKISSEEYTSLSAQNPDYSLTDIVGKSGIEQYMDPTLQGVKGSETVYVDNLGKVIQTLDQIQPQAGNDVYLSIDADLQEVTYNLLEQELAGILYDKIENIKNFDNDSVVSASDIIIPIDDVYFALINNNTIDITHLSSEEATDVESTVYAAFLTKQAQVFDELQAEFTSEAPTAFGDMQDESQDYITYIINMLKENNVLLTSEIDSSDTTFQSWSAGTLSLKDYLNYAISMNWVDISQFSLDEKYSDSTEVYKNLINYIIEELTDDTAFAKIEYKYMIQQNLISGTQISLILFDQGALDYDSNQIDALNNGTISAYDFIKNKIQSLEITPAQLALDPCSASTVVTDTDTGEILALVTYPGYDNNKLANKVDSKYYASLTSDLSNPLYNYATQERTAPGSTFKMVTATAGLAEGAITTTETIETKGIFEEITPSPRCWIFPSNHGTINVSEAIMDSCNYFFYDVGYRLSLNASIYNAQQGTDTLTRYAQMYGLGENTGIEIPENSPQIADEFPITASIGQSNHNYTTTELSRYVTAVANSGTLYNFSLLQKVTDSSGETLETFGPTVNSTINVLDADEWNAIHIGMQMVVTELEQFDEFPIQVAGKTGTAQQVLNRPNHALFVGYAPFDDPQISIATRIAYGYTSHNAAAISRQVLAYYFGVNTREELVTGQAVDVNNSTNSFTD